MKKWTAHQRIVVGLTAAILGIVALGVSAIVRLINIEDLSRLIATDSMPGLSCWKGIGIRRLAP
jgi:hypothetical protein